MTTTTPSEHTGHPCRLCGCHLSSGYPFTVCDDCWPQTTIGRASDRAGQAMTAAERARYGRIVFAVDFPPDDGEFHWETVGDACRADCCRTAESVIAAYLRDHAGERGAVIERAAQSLSDELRAWSTVSPYNFSPNVYKALIAMRKALADPVLARGGTEETDE